MTRYFLMTYESKYDKGLEHKKKLNFAFGRFDFSPQRRKEHKGFLLRKVKKTIFLLYVLRVPVYS